MVGMFLAIETLLEFEAVLYNVPELLLALCFIGG
jgi:hypothetical protein